MTQKSTRRGTSLRIALLPLVACAVLSARLEGAQAGSQALARLELEPPSEDSFFLRGTLPLPPGFFVEERDGPYPFLVRQPDGTMVLPQVEIVARHPQPESGVSVVELIAKVRNDAESVSVPDGTIGYDVLSSIGFDVNSLLPVGNQIEQGNDVFDEIELTPAVKELVGSPFGLVLSVRDAFANGYAATLMGSDVSTFGQLGAFELQRRGHSTLQSRRYVTAMHDGSPTFGPLLPHHFGVHVYTTLWAKEDFISIDLRFNNGASNNDPANSADDPLGKLYFRDLVAVVPPGWKLLNVMDDTSFGTAFPFVAGWNVHPLIDNPENYARNVIPAYGQFHRRLLMVRDGAEQRARAHAAYEGLGFATRGTSLDGFPLYSWWNPFSSNFLAQRAALPHFDQLGRSFVRDKLTNEYETLAGHLAAGTAGEIPLVSGAVGWAHPYGQAYGGITGGGGIHLYEGVPTAYAASADGVRYYETLHRMKADRQPSVLYDADGTPTTVEENLVQGPHGPYFPGKFYMKPLPGNDPFGYKDAPTDQIDWIAANGYKPPYEDELIGFEAIDQQHLIRYTRAPKALVWLTNDALSRDDLLMQAALVELSYNMYPSTQNGEPVSTGMLADRQFIDAHPGKGFGFGRAEGWVIDTMAATYAVASPAWRAAKLHWFDDLVDLVTDGQASCTGILQGQSGPKWLDYNYRARQAYEAAICENGLYGVLRSVYKDGSPMGERLETVLRRSLYAFIGTQSWDPVRKAPYQQIAIGPLDENQPLYCNGLPGDGFTPTEWDLYQCWSSFAYGFVLTGDYQFLVRAEEMSASTDLLNSLENSGLNNIGNKSALTATMQLLLQ